MFKFLNGETAFLLQIRERPFVVSGFGQRETPMKSVLLKAKIDLTLRVSASGFAATERASFFFVLRYLRRVVAAAIRNVCRSCTSLSVTLPPSPLWHHPTSTQCPHLLFVFTAIGSTQY